VKVIQDLFLDNPMMVEIKRFLRRFLGPRPGAQQAVAIALIIIAYVGLLALFASVREIQPETVIYVQLVLYCILLPAMLQGSVAGEREKRTWETLLAAPVTKAQIVVAKYAGAATGVVLIAVLMLPLWLVSSANKVDFDRYTANASEHPSPAMMVHAEIVALTFGLALAAWCLFVSVRSRRTFSAQGMIYGSMALALIVWPMLVSSMGHVDWAIQILASPMHPFIVVASILDRSERASSVHIWGLSTCLFLGFTVVMLVWAEYTLRFAEMDVRFIPRRHRASNRQP
jgi:ABC-type Na+ efflux pump permease subunit